MGMTDAEGGIWERAYQRTRKRLERAGEDPEVIRQEASRVAAEAVDAARRGEEEPDFGRARMSPEERGGARRRRSARRTVIVLNVDDSTARALRAEAAIKGVPLTSIVGSLVARWAKRRARASRSSSPADDDTNGSTE